MIQASGLPRWTEPVTLRGSSDATAGRAIASMKDDGVEYDARMLHLEDVDYAKPLAEELEAYYEPFKRKHPYVGDETVKPKAIARDLYDLGFDFNQYITHYGLNRSEGVVLRYLTDAYKSLVQNVPENLKSKAVLDVEAGTGGPARGVKVVLYILRGD